MRHEGDAGTVLSLEEVTALRMLRSLVRAAARRVSDKNRGRVFNLDIPRTVNDRNDHNEAKEAATVLLGMSKTRQPAMPTGTGTAPTAPTRSSRPAARPRA